MAQIVRVGPNFASMLYSTSVLSARAHVYSDKNGYAPCIHRVAKLGYSSHGQCALSTGSMQHVGQLSPLEQPKGSHQLSSSALHSQQLLVLSQYAPSLQSECELQGSAVCVSLPSPTPNSAFTRATYGSNKQSQSRKRIGYRFKLAQRLGHRTIVKVWVSPVFTILMQTNQ